MQSFFLLKKLLIYSILECKWNKYIDFCDEKYIKYEIYKSYII